MKEAIGQAKNFEKFFEFFGKSIEEMDKVINPMYITAQKMEELIKKTLFIMSIFIQAKQVEPFIKELTGKNIPQDLMSI